MFVPITPPWNLLAAQLEKKKKKKKKTALETVCYLFEWLKIDIRSKQLSREKKKVLSRPSKY